MSDVDADLAVVGAACVFRSLQGVKLTKAQEATFRELLKNADAKLPELQKVLLERLAATKVETQTPEEVVDSVIDARLEPIKQRLKEKVMRSGAGASK